MITGNFFSENCFSRESLKSSDGALPIFAQNCSRFISVAVNASNYVYIALKKSVAGGTSTLVGSLNTAVTALTALTPSALTLNVNGNTFGADDVLTVAFTKYIATATADVSMTASTSLAELGLDLEEGY